MQIRVVCNKVKSIEEMRRDEEAKAHWKAIYGKLTNGQPGTLGAATNRGAPQVMRLSMVFALVDGSPIIQIRHQEAALALWNRCFQSAVKFFGSKIKNKHAQRIYDELKKRPKGMKRSEITVQIFKRNIHRDQLSAALLELTDLQLAYSVEEATGGRDAQRWFVKLVGNS